LKEARTLLVGVSGISGAGKSTLIQKLQTALEATALFWDDYDDSSSGPDDYVKWYETSKNYDDWVYDDLTDTLKKLKDGEKVICKATGLELLPANYILFDAPLGYLHKATGKYIDVLIFLDTPLDIALARRLKRDYQRHKKPEKIIEELDEYLSRSRPLYALSTEQKNLSDLIIDGCLPLEKQVQEALFFLSKKNKALS